MDVRRLLLAGLAAGLAASLTVSHATFAGASGPVLTDHGQRGPSSGSGPGSGDGGGGGGHDGEYGVYAAAAARPTPAAITTAPSQLAPATPGATSAPAVPPTAPAVPPAVSPPTASETLAVAGAGVLFACLVVAGFVARRRLLRGWDETHLDPSAT